MTMGAGAGVIAAAGATFTKYGAPITGAIFVLLATAIVVLWVTLWKRIQVKDMELASLRRAHAAELKAVTEKAEKEAKIMENKYDKVVEKLQSQTIEFYERIEKLHQERSTELRDLIDNVSKNTRSFADSFHDLRHTIKDSFAEWAEFKRSQDLDRKQTA